MNSFTQQDIRRSGVADGARAVSGLPNRGAYEYQQERGTAELVPHARLSGPTPWVVAIMVTLTVIAAAAGLALSHIATVARSELAGGLTIQILDSNPTKRIQETQASLALLSREKGVSHVRLVPDDEVDALLSPWLGAGVAGTDVNNGADMGDTIPVPALLDAHLDGVITTARLEALRHDLVRAAPSARIDAQAGWLRPVFGVMTSLQWLALALIALLAVAMASAVLLAARTALGHHHATIEIIHLLGGTDSQIARIFQRTIGMDAAVGGAAGFMAAVLVIFILGERFAALDAGLVTGGGLGFVDWLILMLIPVAGVGLAMLTARLSVIATLRKTL